MPGDRMGVMRGLSSLTSWLHNQRPALKPGFNGPNNHWHLFEQLFQILKHGVFFVRVRAIGEKELLAQVQCLSLHCSGTQPVLYRNQELSQREFSPVGDACRLRVEIIDRTPFAMSDGGTLLAPWCERLRIMFLFELAPEQIANAQLIRDLAPVSLS